MRETHEIELTEQNFAEEVKEGVTLVDFWASWCGPCRMQNPIVEKVSEDMQGRAKVAKCNVDEQPGVAAQFGIRSIPTLVIIKDGKEVNRLVGLQSESQLKAQLVQYL